MATDRDAPDALAVRLQIIDLLTGIFVPATAASAWPDLLPEQRAVMFVVLAIFSIAPTWWGTLIAIAHAVKSPIRRVLIHLYAYSAFLSYLAIIPLGLAFCFGRFDNAGQTLLLLFLIGLSTTIVLSIGKVEGERQAAIRRRVYEMRTTPEAPAGEAANEALSASSRHV